MNGGIPPLPLTPSWRGKQTFYFIVYYIYLLIGYVWTSLYAYIAWTEKHLPYNSLPYYGRTRL